MLPELRMNDFRMKYFLHLLNNQVSVKGKRFWTMLQSEMNLKSIFIKFYDQIESQNVDLERDVADVPRITLK